VDSEAEDEHTKNRCVLRWLTETILRHEVVSLSLEAIVTDFSRGVLKLEVDELLS
jgi:hypothetical protein